MRAAARVVSLLAVLLLVPSFVHAQAVIAGIVKDPSGAVLPGVSVEATSPALIEKVRTAVTDGNGQYRVEDLRRPARASEDPDHPEPRPLSVTRLPARLHGAA